MKMNLDVDVDLDTELDTIIRDMESGASADYTASRGEYLNAILIAAYLGYDFVDVQGLISFDEKGRLAEEPTNKALANELSKHEYAVVPGFYGTMPDGSIKTFSRGGSDITGSLVAKAVRADIYENWTDVSGFMSADPRIVKDPRPIEEISYKELRELSYMGAAVLHEDAIYPVRASEIPIMIRNTNAPEDKGTLITAHPTQQAIDNIVTGIAGKKDFTVISLYKNRLHYDLAFLRRLGSILEDYKIPLEHLPSGIDDMSVVVNSSDIQGRLDELLEEMERRLRPDSIEVYENIALLATVGVGMSYRPGVSARLFTALAEAGVNIRMIDQGSSEMNIIVGVQNRDFEKATKAIYEAFIAREER